jgi:hypothetical protein
MHDDDDDDDDDENGEWWLIDYITHNKHNNTSSSFIYLYYVLCESIFYFSLFSLSSNYRNSIYLSMPKCALHHLKACMFTSLHHVNTIRALLTIASSSPASDTSKQLS